MKAREASILLLILGFISIIPGSIATEEEWDYDDYLYSLDIVSYDEPITAGQTGSIKVKVGANTDVVIHVEFKGEFSWGHWPFYSAEIPVSSGVSTVSAEVNVPFKCLIEPVSGFVYYVYVTLPGDEWSQSAWGLAQSITVTPPEEVTYDELVVCMSHLKWLVDTSSLSDGVKNNLFSKLESAGLQIDRAYGTGRMGRLHGAVGSLGSFINGMVSDNEAAAYPDSGFWKDQASYIIERIETVIS